MGMCVGSSWGDLSHGQLVRDRKIVESFRLEKTFQVTESSVNASLLKRVPGWEVEVRCVET